MHSGHTEFQGYCVLAQSQKVCSEVEVRSTTAPALLHTHTGGVVGPSGLKFQVEASMRDVF